VGVTNSRAGHRSHPDLLTIFGWADEIRREHEGADTGEPA
jgi:hypothetical protein